MEKQSLVDRLVEIGLELIRDVKSRKFLLTVAFVTLVLGNVTYDLGISVASLALVAFVIVTYVLVEGILDAGYRTE